MLGRVNCATTKHQNLTEALGIRPTSSLRGSSGAFLKDGVGIEGLEFERFFLDDRNILAAGLLVGFVLRTRDVEADGAENFGVKLDLGGRQSEGFDRLVEDDLIAVDGEAALGDHRSDVAGRDRTIKLAGIAGGADDARTTCPRAWWKPPRLRPCAQGCPLRVGRGGHQTLSCCLRLPEAPFSAAAG